MSIFADREIARLDKQEKRRMEIYGYQYKPHGGWDSPEQEQAYKRAFREGTTANAAAEPDGIEEIRESEKVADPVRKEWTGNQQLLVLERYDDSALGDAFVEAHPEMIWNISRKTWMCYDSKLGIWADYDEEKAGKLIDGFLKKLQVDGEAHFGKDKFSASQRLGEQRAQDALTKKAKIKRHINQHELDADPYRRVFLNGVFDPRSPEKGMAPFDSELYATRAVDLNYDPKATHPRLKDVLAPLPDDCHHWFQLMAGQSMLGFQPAAEFGIFFYGPTAGNGKSTIIDALEATAGSFVEDNATKNGYSGRPDQGTLLAGDNYDLVSFEGLSQAILEELPDKMIHSSPFKRLIGTDSFKGRQIYQKNRTIYNRATLWISCNIFPSIDSSDQGVIRRIKVVPFKKKYVDTIAELSKYPAGMAFLKDPSLKEMVKHDRPLLEAILAFRMEGAIRWCATPASARAALEGAVPESVENETAERLGREDTIQTWLDDCMIFDLTEDENGNELPPVNYCLTSDLFKSYSAHLKASGHAYGVKLNTFSDRFELNRTVQANRLKKERGRVGGLDHSRFETADGEFDKPGTTPRHVKGIRFRNVLDDNEIKAGMSAEATKRAKLADLVFQAKLAGISMDDLAAAISLPVEDKGMTSDLEEFDDAELKAA